jgi:hypothetical protein
MAYIKPIEFWLFVNPYRKSIPRQLQVKPRRGLTPLSQENCQFPARIDLRNFFGQEGIPARARKNWLFGQVLSGSCRM